MSYIDAFLIPVETANRETYRAHEAKWWPSFRDLGATEMVVAWGDDVPLGKVTDFPRAVKLEANETLALAWMIWPDKATRDSAHREMERRSKEDPEMSAEAMPFDGMRMVFGGFEALLREKA